MSRPSISDLAPQDTRLFFVLYFSWTIFNGYSFSDNTPSPKAAIALAKSPSLEETVRLRQSLILGDGVDQRLSSTLLQSLLSPLSNLGNGYYNNLSLKIQFGELEAKFGRLFGVVLLGLLYSKDWSRL
ncbi:hypothetical protein L1887_24135 [Cichorium endivia]|nr:hypothetical protein L1887_24135 [Cichorium endivia]